MSSSITQDITFNYQLNIVSLVKVVWLTILIFFDLYLMRGGKMCLLDIILAKLYDSDDKECVTESSNTSKERGTNQ